MKLALTCFIILACSTLATQSQELLVSHVRTFHQPTSNLQKCEGTCYSQNRSASVTQECRVRTYCIVNCDNPSQPQIICSPKD